MMKSKKKMVIIIGLLLIILIIGIFTLIKVGRNTSKADMFKDYLSSREWQATTEQGGGYMKYGKDGSFSYIGWDDGNGPWGYNIYEEFDYNAFLNTIIVSTLGEKAYIKVLDYDLEYMKLMIEGCEVEFKGTVKEDIEPDYVNKVIGFYLTEVNYSLDNDGLINILKKEGNEVECTLEGYENYDLGYVTYDLADEVKYEKLEISMETEEHSEISTEEGEKLIKESGYTEVIWYNEDGEIEKILFYKYANEAE